MRSILCVTGLIAWLAVEGGAQPAVVLFSGDWCGACVAMKPVWKRFAGSYRGPMRVIYIDVDRDNRYRELWQKGGDIPQVVWLDASSRVRKRLPGLVTVEQLRRITRQLER